MQHLLHMFRRLIDRNEYIFFRAEKERNLGWENIEWLSSVSLISFRAQICDFWKHSRASDDKCL